MSVLEEINEHLIRLAPDAQQRVLDFAKRLVRDPTPRRRGARVEDMLKAAGRISAEDLRQMEKVIEEDCERINPNGW